MSPSGPWKASTSTGAVMRSRPGIQRRLTWAIAALVGGVLLAQALFLLFYGQGRFHRYVERSARSYATLAVEPICEAYRRYYTRGTSKFRDQLEQTVALSADLEGLAIYDVEGRLLYAVDRRGGRQGEGILAGPVVDARLRTAIRGIDQGSWSQEVDSSSHSGPFWGLASPEPNLVVVQPYPEDWGRRSMSVVFWFGYDSAHTAVVRLGLGLACLALAALGLGMVFAAVLAKKTLRPVETLVRGARQLAIGNLDHRIRLRSGDELEVLGEALDRMAAQLASTIDELEESNRSLGDMNRELQELDQVKSDLLANVSHELRTPLTAISGYVEALGTGLLGEVDTVQEKALGVVERNIHRLGSMIDQLLGYSRMDAGRLEVDLRPFDLRIVACQVVELVGGALGHDHDLQLHWPEDLPEVFGDPARIAQVLENLLTNAVKFSAAGSQVLLRAEEVADGLRVEVVDHGIGIDPEHRQRIFDRFYQVDASARRHYGGMGLGLAIVHQILELHHSPIEVQSRLDRGSTFSFVLPLARERSAYLPTQAGRRVVLIDDDSAFVQPLAALLTAEGYHVQATSSLERGATLIRRNQPDAVLLDRLLPDGDGFDLVAGLKEDPTTRHIPCILCTYRPERRLGLSRGARHYWTKPITPEETVARLEKALEQSRAEAAPGLTSAEGTESESGGSGRVGGASATLSGDPSRDTVS